MTSTLVQLHVKTFFNLVTMACVVTNIVLMRYLVQLRDKQCPCADDWRNGALIALFGANTLVSLLHLSGLATRLPPYAHTLSTVLQICTTVVGVSYMYKLLDVDCQTCTKSPVRYLMNALMNYRLVAYTLLVSAILFESAVLVMHSRSKS